MEMLLNLARETALRRAVMICIGGGATAKTYRDARRQFLDLDLESTGTIIEGVQYGSSRKLSSPDFARSVLACIDFSHYF